MCASVDGVAIALPYLYSLRNTGLIQRGDLPKGCALRDVNSIRDIARPCLRAIRKTDGEDMCMVAKNFQWAPVSLMDLRYIFSELHHRLYITG